MEVFCRSTVAGRRGRLSNTALCCWRCDTTPGAAACVVGWTPWGVPVRCMCGRVKFWLWRQGFGRVGEECARLTQHAGGGWLRCAACTSVIACNECAHCFTDAHALPDLDQSTQLRTPAAAEQSTARPRVAPAAQHRARCCFAPPPPRPPRRAVRQRGRHGPGWGCVLQRHQPPGSISQRCRGGKFHPDEPTLVLIWDHLPDEYVVDTTMPSSQAAYPAPMHH